MKRNAIRTLAGVASAIAVTMAATGASAQSNRPVTVVVPFAAGGGTDITTRAMQSGLTDALDANIVVKNTAGVAALWVSAKSPAPARMDARSAWRRSAR
ncbi:hypothetical protein ACFQFQ_23595 [Sulfitobacter porphyrae]|uniref:Tripartite tricarboxylate transporter family receptor n=1 Tax=Sulfitobacter porphyrae TaxID=1246864 RepID=A0ABW2B9R2_9RHOB